MSDRLGGQTLAEMQSADGQSSYESSGSGSGSSNSRLAAVPVKPVKSPLRNSRHASSDDISEQHERLASSSASSSSSIQPEKSLEMAKLNSIHSTPEHASKHSSHFGSSSFASVSDETKVHQRSETSNTSSSVPDATSSAPSSTFLSVTGSARKRAPSDASSGIRAMSSWFSGSVTDDEEINSMPSSPTGSVWPLESASLLERARDALTNDSQLTARQVQAQEEQSAGFPPSPSTSTATTSSTPQQSTSQMQNQQAITSSTRARLASASSSKRSATLPNQPDNSSPISRSTSVSHTSVNNAKINRSLSKTGGGIISRLKRISRKEKRASTLDNPLLPEDPFEALNRPAIVKLQSLREGVSTEAASQHSPLETSEQEQDPTSLTSLRRSSRQADLPIQDASRERTPVFAEDRVKSIHSVQPSLVDDESILERDSPPSSPLRDEEQDEDDETWDVPDTMPDTPIDALSHFGAPQKDGKTDAGASPKDVMGENEDWQMQSVPGSFFSTTDQNADTTATLNNSQQQTQEQDQSAKSATIVRAPSLTITSPLDDNAVHHVNEATEYTQALSRQASEDKSSDGAPVESNNTASPSDANDDEAITPRAIAEPNRSSYFDAPSMASSNSREALSPPTLNETASWAGFERMAVSTPLQYEDAWLHKARLAQEERHYLVRFMMTKQMVWEMERLYLITSFKALDSPSPPSKLPSNDVTYLKATPGYVTPDLPIMRLVARHIFVTCPIFSAAVPIEGSAAERTRTTNAAKFFDKGILPFCRFLHANAVAKSVDINGEWPSELFDAPSTLNRVGAAGIKVLVRFLTALIDNRGHGFLWSKVASPTAFEYMGHRTTLNLLKQGGMEVNVVGSRVQPATGECEFIVSVRRFGFPPAFVIRTESDFYSYALSLAHELGPQVRVRPVPAPEGDSLVLQPTFEDGNAQRSSFDSSTPPSSLRGKNAHGSGSDLLARNGTVSSKKQTASPKQATAPRLLEVDKPTSNTSSAANDLLSNLPSSGKNKSSVSLASATSSNGLRRKSVDVPPKTPTSPVSSVRERSSTRMFKTFTAANSTLGTSSSKNMSMTDLASLSSSSAAPISSGEESRRRQMRAWLRDALSIRGAGHAEQTRQFLQNDAFGERELRPGTRKDVVSRLELDEAARRERERTTAEAPREVIELRAEISQLWRECVEGDGVERAFKAVQHNETFSSLPLPYQRMVSWSNLQLATFLHHVFLDSHEARQNFERFQELVSAIPWRMLSLAMRERTGLMMQKIQASMADKIVRNRLLAVFLDDSPTDKVQAELAALKKRLGSTVIRKLEVYAQSPNWQKSIVRRAAQQAEIPLVAAIMRGSDRPLLAADGVKKVVSATRVYREFMQSQPTYAERKAKLKANVEVRLIHDMQRALRLICLQRDGKAFRASLEDKEGELKGAVEALLEPVLDLVRRLHRTRSSIVLRRRGSQASTTSGGNADERSHDVVMDLQQFCLKLLDVLAGARARVQDPWRSLSMLTLLLDDAVPTWYRLLHAASLGDSLLHDVAIWLQNIANVLQFHHGMGQGDEAGKDLLARFWPTPSSADDEQKSSKSSSSAVAGDDKLPLQHGKVDRVALEAIVEEAWRKRTRQFETACRWAAGETDGELDIQLFGEGGKTRTEPYELPKLKPGPSAKVQSSLIRLLPGFRGAVERVLGADPGTAW